jgi:hypothetical protein
MCVNNGNVIPAGESTVLVTFVGGPLHGAQRELIPSEHIEHPLPDGGQMRYERRVLLASRPDRSPELVWMHIAYAPLGMSDWAFFDLARSLAGAIDAL